MNSIKIRTATANDTASILDIYRYYVMNIAVTFECSVPSLDEFQARIEIRSVPEKIFVKQGLYGLNTIP